MVKRGGGGLFILIFVSKEGGIGEGLKREGAKSEGGGGVRYSYICVLPN